MIKLDAVGWPEHKASMTISHNRHLDYYETIVKAIGKRDATYDRDDFPDEGEIVRCIETGHVWSIQWYPNSPVGFNRVCASTLSRALAAALQVQAGQDPGP